MSTRNLDKLFRPASVALIGASDRGGSVGRAVMTNLMAGGFEGPIWAVNKRHREVAGQPAYKQVKDLPEGPDLGVICTPPDTVPDLLDELGERGTRAAVIISAGFGQGSDDQPGAVASAELLKRAGRWGMRLLGPNCVGLIVPPIGLNASFAPGMAQSGQLAFVTQSGAMATAVLDWASERGIGFSGFVSLGNALDVDVADVIDFLGADSRTRAILLYLESVNQGRKFMSAARAAARNKPIIVVKSGRAPEGAAAAASHTGALSGSDEVFDSVIRRAGALRVHSIGDLFATAELLARPRPIKGPGLAILTNGGGPGVMATDALVLAGGHLARLGETTVARLNECLPANWSGANPVDIIGDAGAARYQKALEILGDDPAVDAVLIIHAPTALADSESIAAELIEPARALRQPVIACWLGGASARAASRRFSDAGLASFSQPEEAVQAFLRLVEYRVNQESLTEVPARAPEGQRYDTVGARERINKAAEQGQRWLNEVDAKAVLAAYGLPVVDTRLAENADQAAELAKAIGYPVAVKVVSPDITHKSDVGGVVLNIDDEAGLRQAIAAIEQRLAEHGQASLTGWAVQAMVRQRNALELIVGASTDPVFGPVVLFGQGGTAVEVLKDHALALPPLNDHLAGRQIARTRVSRLMAGYRSQAAIPTEPVADVLTRIACLVTEQTEIESLDINPLLASADGLVALDARIELRDPEAGPRPVPAITPYPSQLVETVAFNDQSIVLRPIRPEDEPAHQAFFQRLAQEDVRFRFFGLIRELEHGQMARYTQIDYDREMAFVAVEKPPGNETLGVVRAVFDSSYRRAEFAVVVRSDIKGRGLGRLLLEKLIRYCRDTGVVELLGQVLADNQRMLSLAEDLGFRQKPPRDGVCEVILTLNPEPKD
ncbi:MAG: bifunctional acetate--CoA ligase family protein/GNAT family N-acetyltransferase [Wenzhouxiangella sp.]